MFFYLLLLEILVQVFGEPPLQPFLTKNGHFEDSDLDLLETCNIGPISCLDSKYRTYDGSCNNLAHPSLGKAKTSFTRIFKSRYSDGKALPPKSLNGSELPNSRTLSYSLYPDGDAPDNVSLAVMSFGQFFAHDIAVSLQPSDVGDCCASDDPLTCYSVQVSEDPFYSEYKQTCINLVRSQTTLIGLCDDSEPNQQINGVTHFIDASHVYGEDKETADSIRENVGGRLLVSTSPGGRSFLPHTSGASCFNSNFCYKAGDDRINQNTHLTTLHILFHREHNRIADALATVHPSWDDETLYQESRAILIAELQHIVTTGYLTSILGEDFLDYLEPQGTLYSELVPPLIINSVTAGVFRILHSGIQGKLNLYNYQLDPTKNINISDYLNSPSIIEEENNFDELLLGLVTQPMQQIDEIYTSQMNELMFHGLKDFGSDLTALDIQRGRDHAIASYASVLSACQEVEIEDFDDLTDFLSEENISKLKDLYFSVHDIDLFVGANLETKSEGERLSPVTKCLLAEQFYRLIAGDRFWYQAEGQPHSFTSSQIDEVKKASLSKVICDNSDGIVNIAGNVFYTPGESNPIVACEDLPSLNLALF